MLKNTRKCKHCMKTYEYGFWGTGLKYCSKECRENSIRYYAKTYYLRNKKPKHTEKLCLLCKRNIVIMGKRKTINKYCSNRCMEMAQRIRGSKSKFVTIKIPIKDIPLIFNGKT